MIRHTWGLLAAVWWLLWASPAYFITYIIGAFVIGAQQG